MSIKELLENWEFWMSLLNILITGGLGFIVWQSTEKYNKTQIKVTKKQHNNNLEIQKHQIELELFREFNARYDKLNNNLNNILTLENNYKQLKGKAPQAIKDIVLPIKNDYKIKEDELTNSLMDYFNLCAEEYYWYKNKRISKKIWKSWKVGMNGYYSKSAVIRNLWREEIKGDGYKSYYLKKGDNLFTEVEEQVSEKVNLN